MCNNLKKCNQNQQICFLFYQTTALKITLDQCTPFTRNSKMRKVILMKSIQIALIPYTVTVPSRRNVILFNSSCFCSISVILTLQCNCNICLIRKQQYLTYFVAVCSFTNLFVCSLSYLTGDFGKVRWQQTYQVTPLFLVICSMFFVLYAHTYVNSLNLPGRSAATYMYVPNTPVVMNRR